MLATYDTLEEAGNAVAAVVASGLLPGALEFIDPLAIKASESASGAGYPPDAGAFLIAELEGETTQVEAEFATLLDLIYRSGAREVREAESDDERPRSGRDARLKPSCENARRFSGTASTAIPRGPSSRQPAPVPTGSADTRNVPLALGATPNYYGTMNTVIAFAWLGTALIAGKLMRKAVPVFRRLFVPSSILGGLLLLVLGSDVLGGVSGVHIFSPNVRDVWGGIPGFMINIVFAALFLGKSLPKISEIWRKAGPQIAFSHTVAWGQYVVGFGITALVLIPLFSVEPMFGALIEIGFIGGHGTAAGLGESFAELGWPEGQDLALGVATIGVVMGIVTGIVLVNWGVKRGHTAVIKTTKRSEQEMAQAEDTHETVEDELVNDGKTDVPENPLVEVESMEPLAFHLAYIGAAIGVGALILSGLTYLETKLLLPLGAPVLLGHVPLFPFAMIGGIIVEKVHHKFFDGWLDRVLVVRLQGAALDLLIVSALASLTLSAIADAWLPLLILVTVGILWTVGAFVILAPRMMRTHWFERGIGDFGQSLGVTATGLLLMRIVDPENDTPALEAFGYKQLLFEPLVGGGLFTAVSAPLVFTFGLVPMLLTTGVVTLGWLALGLYLGRGSG